MTTLTIPALPDSFVDSEDETVALFVPPALKAWRKLTELANTYARVRAAESDAETSLETSEHPAAVAYREAQSEADEKTEAIQAAMDAEIKAVRAKFAEQRKAANEGLKAMRNETLSALGAAAIEDIDQDALSESYLKNYKALSNVAKLVKDDYPDLVDFVKTSVPSRFAQTPGNSGGTRNSGPRGWTPRLSSVTVNGKSVDPSTLSAAAKVIGIKASEGGRKLLVNKLRETIVTPDNLSTDPDAPNSFSVGYNGEVFNISVVGVDKSSDDSDD